MKKIVSLLFLLMSFLFTDSLVYGVPLKLRVVFEHFTPNDVWLRGMDDYSWSFIPMENKGDGNYEIERQLVSGTTYEFAVCFTHPQYFQGQVRYINVRKGIENATVYMNNQLVNSSFLVDNLNPEYPGANFMFTINNDGIVSPALVPQRLLINDRIPAEVAYKKDTTFYATAPPNYPLVNAWIVILSNNDFIKPSVVDIDYIRLYAITSTGEELIRSQEFDEYNPIYDGGLYVRYPYFPLEVNMISDPMPGTVSNGVLTILPSDVRDKVWHSWAKGFAQVNSQHLGYRMEARYKATGKIAIQGGIDFALADWSSHKEAGQGDWKFETNDIWDTISYSSYSQTVSLLESAFSTQACRHMIKEN